jgi:TolB-like protein/DNA-binding SARP family transcriptional activator/Tfp pilus assembly protein PilF
LDSRLNRAGGIGYWPGMGQEPAPISVQLFGLLRVEHDGRPVALPASRKTRAILGFLALSPRPVSRQRLCDLFFDIPDDPRAALRWSLTKLRPLVDEPGRPRLEAERDALRLDTDGLDLDVLRVQAIAAIPPDLLTAADCSDALDRMTAELLEDCELPDCPAYMAWLATQRQEFHAIAGRLARHLADSSDGADRIRHLHRLVALDPLDEAATAALANALVQAGRREEAHALVAAAERQLRQSGLPAGPALRLALRTAAPPPAPPLPPEAADPRAPGARPIPGSGRLSVAVLPFLNHSADVLVDDLADAFHEAVVHMLSRFRDLEVAGFSKTLAYKGNIRDPAVMGAELGAGHLVGGSILARDGVLKMRYRIVAAADGALATSGDVEHPGLDAFALVEDAPARLAVRLAEALIDAARARALRLPEEDRTAWDHYHAGVVEGLAASPADHGLALAHFNRALACDPGFAKALGSAAWARACLGHGASEDSRNAALLQAHRAIALGGDDAEAIAVGAWAAVHVAQDFDAALRAVEQAVRVNPLSRVAWSTSGWVRAMAGEVETPLQHFDRAERCNPWGAHLDNVDGGRAFCLWQAGRFPEAIAFAERSIERLPGHVGAHAVAMASALGGGDEAGARGAAGRFLAIFPDGPETAAVRSIPLRDPERKAALLAAVGRACALAAPAADARARPVMADAAPVESAAGRGRAALTVVAVLPPLDLSREEVPAYLLEGLFDGVTHALSRFRSLTVVAGASARRFGAKLEDPATVGAALGADLLVGMSVMAGPETLRVRWRAIEARSGRLSASGEVGGALTDVWALQEELAMRVAVEIEPLAQEEAFRRAASRPTASATAYDQYLRGLYAAFGSVRSDYAAGLAAFEAAMAIDPDFAPAAALAPWAAAYGNLIRSREDLARFAALARRAARVAGDDARTLAMAGTAVLYLEQDFDFGEALVLDAIERNPNEYVAWICAGWISVQRGRRDEAFERFARAERLNPLAYGQDGIHAGRALACFFDDRLDEAEGHVAKALQSQPDSPSALSTAVAVSALRADHARLEPRRTRLLTLYPEGLDAFAIRSLPFATPDLRTRFFAALARGGVPGGG